MRKLLKRDELTTEDIDLTELVSETIGLFKPWAAEQGVSLEIEPIPAGLRIRADSVHIQQVLLNLAMNAIDAMQNVPAGMRKLKLRVTRRNREALIAIEDTGVGIPVDKLNSIFGHLLRQSRREPDLDYQLPAPLSAPTAERFGPRTEPRVERCFALL